MTPLGVTIPKDAAERARVELQAWGGIASARILGEDDKEIGLAVVLHASHMALVMGLAREELEKRLRQFGGRVGVKSDWLAADRNLGNFFEVPDTAVGTVQLVKVDFINSDGHKFGTQVTKTTELSDVIMDWLNQQAAGEVRVRW